VDEAQRRLEFSAAHPEVRFTSPPHDYGRWTGEWDEPNGSTTITRYKLTDLLDELEKRFA
jgi:GTP-dependent phosphoenolpyruvate carboxykinase